jgi:ribose 5-phosphate isomerase A
MSEQPNHLDAQKLDAAERAASLVCSGTTVGLGTGSTANHATKAIARDIESGRIRDIRGIATSRRTEDLALELGIPLTTLEEHQEVDITIDGADEVDSSGDLIKGGGGALLREKIVAVATKRYVIIVDETKMVDRLGVEFPLPVEVVTFGWKTLVAPIRALGAEPVLRHDSTGAPFLTAAGNYILDCQFDTGIANTAEVHQALKSHAGVVETGLFVGMKPEVIIGRAATPDT